MMPPHSGNIKSQELIHAYIVCNSLHLRQLFKSLMNLSSVCVTCPCTVALPNLATGVREEEQQLSRDGGGTRVLVEHEERSVLKRQRMRQSLKPSAMLPLSPSAPRTLGGAFGLEEEPVSEELSPPFLPLVPHVAQHVAQVARPSSGARGGGG